MYSLRVLIANSKDNSLYVQKTNRHKRAREFTGCIFHVHQIFHELSRW